MSSNNITHVITNLGDGGAEGVLYRLCITDVNVKHTVVSLMGSGKYGDLLKESGVDVVCLNMPRGHVTLFGFFKLWKILFSRRYSIIQTWMYHADLVAGITAKLAGCKLVFWNIRHSILVVDKTKRSTLVIAKICAFISSYLPTKIACCANSALLAHQSMGYSTHKMQVIPNGFDLNQFRPSIQCRDEWRSKFLLSDSVFLIGMVARFDNQKDHRNLFQALSHCSIHPDKWKLVLIGSGMDDSNSELVKYLVDLSIIDNVILHGVEKNISAIMPALDVKVLPSLTEGFPNVIGEAMACCVPCIVTDVGESGLIVGDTGWVIEPGKPKLLHDVLVEAYKLWQDDNEWRRRQKTTRARIRDNYDIKEMLKQYHKLWGLSK